MDLFHPLILAFECCLIYDHPIFSRSIGRYLPIDISHLRNSSCSPSTRFVC